MDVSFRAPFDPSPDGSKLKPVMSVHRESGQMMLLLSNTRILASAEEWRRLWALIDRGLEQMAKPESHQDLVFEVDGMYFEPTRAQLAVVK